MSPTSYAHAAMTAELEHAGAPPPIEPGDVVSRMDRAPFYQVVATEGDWAWARDLVTGAYVTLLRSNYRPRPTESAATA